MGNAYTHTRIHTPQGVFLSRVITQSKRRLAQDQTALSQHLPNPAFVIDTLSAFAAAPFSSKYCSVTHITRSSNSLNTIMWRIKKKKATGCKTAFYTNRLLPCVEDSIPLMVSFECRFESVSFFIWFWICYRQINLCMCYTSSKFSL